MLIAIHTNHSHNIEPKKGSEPTELAIKGMKKAAIVVPIMIFSHRENFI